MYVSPKYSVWQHFETLCLVACKMVITSVGLVSSFLDTIRVSIMTIFTLFDTSRVRVLDDFLYYYTFFCFFLFWRYYSGLQTMQESSFQGNIGVVSMWLKIVLTQTLTRAYKDSLTLTYPLNINIWLILQYLYPWVGYLMPLLMLIIDTVHTPVHQTNTGFVLIERAISRCWKW